MSESIASLVEKIKADGVESGRKAAEEILADARAKARQILDDANNDAAGIIARANADAEAIARQQRHELELAARDAVLRAREEIVRTIHTALRYRSEAVLADEATLTSLIRDMLVEYARQDARQISPITLHVNETAVARVTEWLIAQKIDDANADVAMDVDLQANLQKLGFEYTVNEATVEVTVDSVAEVLGQLVSAKVREILRAG